MNYNYSDIIEELIQIKINKYRTSQKYRFQRQAYNDIIKYLKQNYDLNKKPDKGDIMKMNISSNMKNKIIDIIFSKKRRISGQKFINFSRKFIEPLVKKIIKYKGIRVTGSYRRKNKYINDIDLILIIKKNPVLEINNFLNFLNYKFNIKIDEVTKHRRLLKVNIIYTKKKIKIDLFTCYSKEFVPMLIHTTGPKIFNMKTRKYLKKKRF